MSDIPRCCKCGIFVNYRKTPMITVHGEKASRRVCSIQHGIDISEPLGITIDDNDSNKGIEVGIAPNKDDMPLWARNLYNKFEDSLEHISD